jgi:xyloglucan-specific endo-beta-1,4-glucanase
MVSERTRRFHPANCEFVISSLVATGADLGPSNLYIGTNDNGQMVFSWLGPSNLTSFSGDISSLVRRVARYGGPATSDYLGMVQFGSESFHTTNGANVTFTAKSVLLNVVDGVAPVESVAAGHITDITLLASIFCLAVFVIAS